MRANLPPAKFNQPGRAPLRVGAAPLAPCRRPSSRPRRALSTDETARLFLLAVVPLLVRLTRQRLLGGAEKPFGLFTRPSARLASDTIFGFKSALAQITGSALEALLLLGQFKRPEAAKQAANCWLVVGIEPGP